MTKIELFQRVALRRDVPEEGLREGDVATVVERLGPPDDEEFILEVFSAVGETLGVAAVPASAIRPLSPDEVWSVRPLSKTR